MNFNVTPASAAVLWQGDNLFQLMGTRWAPSSGAYMVLAAAIMVPTVWLPDLKSLSYLGFAGITATLTVTAAVAYTLLTGEAAATQLQTLNYKSRFYPNPTPKLGRISTLDLM